MMPHWYSCNTYKLLRKKDFASTSENNPPSLIQLFPFLQKHFIPTAVPKLEDVSPPLEKGRRKGGGRSMSVQQKVCSSVSKSLSCNGGKHLELRSDQKIGYSRFTMFVKLYVWQKLIQNEHKSKKFFLDFTITCHIPEWIWFVEHVLICLNLPHDQFGHFMLRTPLKELY